MLNRRNRAIIAAVERGYIIDDDGNVFSPRRKLNPFLAGKKWRYLYFAINFEGMTVTIKVHRFQAYKKYRNEIFKEKIVVRHKNNIKTDNSVDNILIGTMSDNSFDNPPELRVEIARKAAVKLRKFTDDEIRQIRTDRAKGLTHRALAKKYVKCNHASIKNILNGTTYKNVA